MCELQKTISPDLLRSMILNELSEPVVFRGLLDWNILSWSLKDWAERLRNQKMPFRTGFKKRTKVPQWERTCSSLNLTMQQFVEMAASNVGSEDERWLYFDYKYMNQWFVDHKEILQTVNWAAVGFPEVTGLESCVWIGSDGAHTPCHMDSYGCNLVAQVYGTKHWILFPPEESVQMSPTRVPYEESSVYSKHDFYSPSIKSELRGARLVLLKPGEILLVPHHWWHYVENIGTAISINTWIPLECDDDARLEESLVKLFVSQICKDLPRPELVLNPNEDDVTDCPLIASVKLVEACVERCKVKQEANRRVDEKHQVVGKNMKSMGMMIPIKESSVDEFKTYLNEKQKRFESTKVTSHFECDADTSAETIINAFCHPDVISKVKSILCNEYEVSSSDCHVDQRR